MTKDEDKKDDADEATKDRGEGGRKNRMRAAPPGLSGGPPPGSAGDRTGSTAPLPALINIIIPAATLARHLRGARRRRQLGA